MANKPNQNTGIRRIAEFDDQVVSLSGEPREVEPVRTRARNVGIRKVGEMDAAAVSLEANDEQESVPQTSQPPDSPAEVSTARRAQVPPLEPSASRSWSERGILIATAAAILVAIYSVWPMLSTQSGVKGWYQKHLMSIMNLNHTLPPDEK